MLVDSDYRTVIILQQMNSEGSVSEFCKRLALTQHMSSNMGDFFIKILKPVTGKTVDKCRFVQVYIQMSASC
jgi:hypothetical protein